MAKTQNSTQKSSGGKKNGGSNGAGNSKAVGKMAELSEGGRATKRNARLFQERRREHELEQGDFYSRLNAGRKTDVMAAIAGELGSYAYPGDNEPSVHFMVRKEVGPKGQMAVIQFEATQRGHELEGRVFDPRIFIPVYYIERFGTSFRSRSQDRMVAATQELICHYLAGVIGTENGVTNEEEETLEELFARTASGDEAMRNMLAEVTGLYGIKCDRGIAVFNSFVKNGGVKIELVTTNISNFEAYGCFLPIHLLRRETLEQVTSEEVYRHQLELFTFLRAELGALINEPKKKFENAPEEVASKNDKKLGAKEQAKQKKKADEAKAKALAEISRLAAVEAMRRSAISIQRAATGRLGFVDLSDEHGQLIVQFSQIGADKAVKVMHMSANHALKLTGVCEDTSVYAGQVARGEIDRFEAQGLKPEEKKAREAFISFLRRKMEEVGVKLHKPSAPKLKLVA